jgi:hypothetical protein
MTLSWASVYRPFAHANTFKPGFRLYFIVLYYLSYQPMKWWAEPEMRRHPTNCDPRRSIWRSAVNADAGVRVSVWGGRERCLCQLGYPARHVGGGGRIRTCTDTFLVP